MFAVACSSGDDEPTTETTAPATTAAPATTPTSVDEEQVRAAMLAAIGDLAGDAELDPEEQECVVQAVVDDAELSQAIVDDAGLASLPPDVRTRAVNLVIGCAPRSIARLAIAEVGLDIDDTASACLEDGLAADPDLLAGMADVALAADGGDITQNIPTGLILQLLALVEKCGVPLSALS
jgi:hypothetical protein